MLHSLLPFVVILPSLAYGLITLYAALTYFRTPAAPATSTPDVTILKPVKGMDAGSYDNFASFCRQNYGGALQIIFAVASHEDPAIPVIQQLMADFPLHNLHLVINPALHGPNHKVSNLINALPLACNDIIIICDSDIRVPADYLSSVTGHFTDPQVGLVTSLYRTTHADRIATALEATGFTAEMIPNVLTALRLEGLSFALGASMAVRRAALEQIGGLETLVEFLADDYQLGNMIHRAGWRIALDRTFVESMIDRDSIIAVLSRQLRWARTMRVSRPGGYLASGITQPFPAAVTAALFAPDLPTALAAIAVLYGMRSAIVTYFSQLLVKDNLFPRWLWLLPLRDMLGFFSWLLSFTGNHVEWRGKRFRIKRCGRLEELV